MPGTREQCGRGPARAYDALTIGPPGEKRAGIRDRDFGGAPHTCAGTTGPTTAVKTRKRPAGSDGGGGGGRVGWGGYLYLYNIIVAWAGT